MALHSRHKIILVVAAFTTLRGVYSQEDDGLPQFLEQVPNITVTVGRDALLSCTVEKLKNFKVAWVQVDTQTILTIHKQVITRNPRISLLHDDHRSWHLQLKNVQESDRGWYMCQVNTDPMRSRQGFVDVVVPPDIIDKETSGDQTVREGQDVTLTCRAKGHPEPTIVWRREDNAEIVLENDNRVPSLRGIGGAGAGSSGSSKSQSQGSALQVEGDTLVLKKVNRLQMGSYLCIASNGIPPSISKRANLKVQFPPVAWVPQQLEGAYIGQELTIECHTEAYPKSINYWTNTKGDMIVADSRYTPIVAEQSYMVYMKLRIHSVQKDDFGHFRCIAKNSLGETDGSIKIYEIEAPAPPSNSLANYIEEIETEVLGSPEPTESNKQNLNKYGQRPSVNDVGDKHNYTKSYYPNKGPSDYQGHTPSKTFANPWPGSTATTICQPIWTSSAMLLFTALLQHL